MIAFVRVDGPVYIYIFLFAPFSPNMRHHLAYDAQLSISEILSIPGLFIYSPYN